MKVYHTTIVVPCYNEAKRLRPDRFRDHVVQWPSVRFIFVDDGSTDSTLKILSDMCDEDSSALRCIRLEQNQGKAEAVRRGVLAAFEDGPGFVGYWDADLATPLSEISAFQQVFESHQQVELVLGSRVKLLGRQIHRRKSRHYLGRCFATIASLLLRLDVYDTQCGAKLFRATPRMASLFEKEFLTSWIFDVELIARFLQTADLLDCNNDAETPSVIRENRADQLGIGAVFNHGDIEPVMPQIYELSLQSWADVAGSKLTLRGVMKCAIDLFVLFFHYRMRSP